MRGEDPTPTLARGRFAHNAPPAVGHRVTGTDYPALRAFTVRSAHAMCDHAPHDCAEAISAAGQLALTQQVRQ